MAATFLVREGKAPNPFAPMMLRGEFDLPICDMCRKDKAKMDRIKGKFLRNLWRLAEKRAGKGGKVKDIERRVAVAWKNVAPQQLPAVPPGVTMEITFGEKKE